MLTLRNLLRFDTALCLACGLPGLLAAGWTAKFLCLARPVCSVCPWRA